MKTVLTYGTFDFFHTGHYNILKRAKALGDYLIVGVTSESYDLDRGKLSVHDSLATRIENVQSTGFADKIIVEEYLGQKIKDIVKYNVDILVVGSDWIGKFDHLRQYCEVVYLERTKNISSTQIREKMSDIFNIGIITEDEDDNDFVNEARYVSGIHVDTVFSKNLKVAENVAQKHELNKFTSSLDEFFSQVGIVYIKSGIGSRYEYIKQSLTHGKHVICEFPFTYDVQEMKELRKLAEKKHLILLENVVTVYLRGFIQLLWLINCNQIGKIINVDASISYDYLQKRNASFDDLALLPLCAAVKILGTKLSGMKKNLFHNDENHVIYGTMDLQFGESTAHLQVGAEIPLKNHLTITGEKGTIEIYDDWWDTGFYELRMFGESSVKRQSFNFEGNGLRYVIQEMMIMINDKRTDCTRLFDDEANLIIELLKK